MWWIARSRTCSSGAEAEQRHAEQGPARQIEGRAWLDRRRAGARRASRGVRGSAARSTTGSGTLSGRPNDLHRLSAARLGRWCAAPRGGARARRRRPRAPRRRAARAAARRRRCCRPARRARAGRGTTAAAARRRAGSASCRGTRHDGRQSHRVVREPRAASDRARQRRHRRRLEQRPQRQLRRPGRRAARDTTWVASSEWPPRSKKSSSTPTRSSRSTSAQIPASSSSTGVRGATIRGAGAGGAPPAPAAPCGRPCRWASAAGPPGARRPRAPCSRAAARRRCRAQLARGRLLAAGDHDRRPAACPRRVLPHHDHRLARPPGCARRAASISPSSMRKPRTLTWWSMRPRNSSSPSAQPARQVAGAVEARARLAGERIRHEALGGQLRPAQVAARHAVAADAQLPGHAHAAPARSRRSST